MPSYDKYDRPSQPDSNCRSCTDFKTWSRKQREITQTSAKSDIIIPSRSTHNDAAPREDCPLDKILLGQSAWGLLHTMAAVYPKEPSEMQKRDMVTFLDSLSRLYPCNYCAKSFQKDLKENPVDVNSSDRLAQWMCQFHNRVNQKLGKPLFNCKQVNERWRDGWKDGSCD